jgi:hypothetical protein
MQPTERAAFRQLLVGIGMLYGKSLHESVLAIWWQAVKHREFNAVKAALNAHVTNPDNGQFMPKPADVARYLEGSRESQALQAWSKVMDTLHRLGSYATVVFDDALIHAVIEDMGGWIHLCHMLTKDVPFRANEFEKRYAAYVLHPPTRYPKQLIGWGEQQNRMGGYEPNPPLLVGDAERALRVYQRGGDKPLRIRSLNELLESAENPSPSAISSQSHEETQ